MQKSHLELFPLVAYNQPFPPENRRLPTPIEGDRDIGIRIDTYDGPVIDPVWELYRLAVRHCGRVATLVEWDEQIPEFAVVCAEAERARALEAEELGLAYAQSA